MTNLLPIELIPNTRPPKFQWRSRVGESVVSMEGTLPAYVDTAVIELLALVKELRADNADLREKLVGFAERIAGQSELLTKRAERSDGPESVIDKAEYSIGRDGPIVQKKTKR